MAAVAIVVGVTAIAVATAGAAAAVLGASVTAVTTSTAVGGLVAGGVEIASQIYRNGIDNMNYTSILLETASGAVNGVLSGVMTSTVSPVARVGARVGKVLLGGATEVLHGINNGQSFKQTMVNAGMSMAIGTAFQMYGVLSDASSGRLSKSFLGKTEFGTGDMLKLSGSLFGRKLYRTSLYAEDVVNKGWDIVKGWF